MFGNLGSLMGKTLCVNRDSLKNKGYKYLVFYALHTNKKSTKTQYAYIFMPLQRLR